MIVAGIVAEYDPFHYGHLFQMRKARELTGADCVVIVLGGDFLQRGTPCMIHKSTRARMALDAGADLVVALPYVFSVNSAREYARGAISILSGMGCVDYISFGCETSNLTLLNRAVETMMREKELSPLIKEKLKSGISWAEAYTQATDRLGGKTVSTLLRKPNNLLACEYLRAIAEQGSTLKAIPVQRAGMREDEIASDKAEEVSFLAASRIRAILSEEGIEAAEPHVPTQTLKLLREAYKSDTPSDIVKRMEHCMFSLLRYRLLTADRSELCNVFSVGEGLENRLSAVVNDPSVRSLRTMVESVGTRRYTKARVMRTLVHILMDFKKEDFEWLRGAACARVLAFNGRGRQLLAHMRHSSEIPVMSNLAGRNRFDARTRRLLELEVKAAGLYNMLQGGNDLTGGEIRFVPFFL